MGFEGTNLFFLEEDCKAGFGVENGREIYRMAEVLLNSLLETMDSRGDERLEHHMRRNLLPTIAFYQALRSTGYPKETAYFLTLKETRKWAEIRRKANARLMRLPLADKVFFRKAKSYISQHFPAAGWEIEWVRNDGKETHFNMRRCAFHEITRDLGYPELCNVFCQNDDIAFMGYGPKIKFWREGTLVDGADHCDFHFGRP